MPAFASAQTLVLKGNVKTDKGEPVVGAAVMLSGGQMGTTTDVDGSFTLRINSPLKADAAIMVSYLGYKPETVVVAGRTDFQIVLTEESTSLEQVVVIGYGTVKKKDLTGALSQIEGEAVANRQTENVSTALQGAIPGVTVTRSSSAPGAAATIRVRGITSMTEAAQDPYVLIDGVPGSLNDVNPNDIDKLIVLKDAASASIYGSQAAAGVILITTKRGGSGGTNVTYNYSLGIDYATATPDYMNASDYMAAVNELRYNDLPASGWNQEYAQDLIDNYAALNAQNPDIYPNTDWYSLLMKDMATRQSHSISIKSGGDRRSTVLNLGFDDVNGLFRKNLNWKRYTIRVNNDMQVYKWLKASTDISLRYVDKLNPHTSPSTEMRYVPSIYNAVWSDGRFAPGKDGKNRYAALMEGGTKTSDSYQASAKIQFDITPFKDLTITALFSPRLTYAKSSDFCKRVSYFSYGETATTSTKYIAECPYTSLEESRGDTFEHTTQAYANYNKTFGDGHNFSAMIGYENFAYDAKTIVAEKQSFSHSLINDLNAGGTTGVLAKSTGNNQLARRSYFGRVMYNYLSKYYVQGNIRRDGSSRFAPEHRWGTFLSASAGWVFTQEKFLQKTQSWLDHGKLRVSYGELGNERIGDYYPYQAVLTSGYPVGYMGGGAGDVTSIPAYSQTSAVITDLTWETTKTFDVGIDLAMLRNRLSISADWYYKRTYDMLLQVPIAPIMGLEDPYDNLGEMNTKGWEVTVGWRDRVGEFTYGLQLNLSDDKSVMGYIGDKEVISGGKIIKQGVEYRSWYGYLSDGLYQTEEEVDASAKLINAVTVGDIRYKNLADSEVGGPIISADMDRVVLGSSLPHLNFGGSIDMAWKGLDFNLVFQGVGKRNAYISDNMIQPLRSQWLNFPSMIGDGNSWSYKNTIERNQHAKYPRYSWGSANNNYAVSDFWLINGAYLRIKNITIGYTLPRSWTDRLSIGSIRFAATLSDFFTFSYFPKGWDPEVGTTSYPITKSVLFSASVKF